MRCSLPLQTVIADTFYNFGLSHVLLRTGYPGFKRAWVRLFRSKAALTLGFPATE
jgi:hypothetical protein